MPMRRSGQAAAADPATTGKLSSAEADQRLRQTPHPERLAVATCTGAHPGLLGLLGRCGRERGLEEVSPTIGGSCEFRTDASV